MEWQPISKQTVWTAIVIEKIKKQRDNLFYFQCPEHTLLDKFLEEIEFNDESKKQISKMEHISGKIDTDIINTDERLLIL